MAKDTYYFSHDYNSRTDEKIKLLVRKHGMLGYGVFWAIIEDLYNNANALRLDCDGIAFDLRVPSEIVCSILTEFDLFVFEGETFGSLSVEKRLNERDYKSTKARESARKRWENANALRTQSEGNAIKERKGKENKVKKTKVIEIPSEEDFVSHAVSKKPNIDKFAIKMKYQAWVENGWKNGNGAPIVNWKSNLNNTIPHIPETKPSEQSGKKPIALLANDKS